MQNIPRPQAQIISAGKLRFQMKLLQCQLSRFQNLDEYFGHHTLPLHSARAASPAKVNYPLKCGVEACKVKTSPALWTCRGHGSHCPAPPLLGGFAALCEMLISALSASRRKDNSGRVGNPARVHYQASDLDSRHWRKNRLTLRRFKICLTGQQRFLIFAPILFR